MAQKEHTIFKSYLYLTSDEENDWRKQIVEIMNEDIDEDEEPITDKDDYAVTERLYEDINMYYDDEKMNLNKKLPNNIIAIADMGLWDGRHKGCKIMGNNLNEVLYFGGCDDLHVYVDRYDVHAEMAHHDGTHYVTYRMIKEGVDADRLLNKQVYEGGLSARDITRLTASLKPYVKQIYRWK